MSRFKPSSWKQNQAVKLEPAFAPSIVGTSVETAAAPAAASAASAVVVEGNNPIEKLAFVLLCLYVLSGFANEFAIRLFGNKAYLSTVLLVALPLVLAVSRNRFRGLRHQMGWWWIVFLGCLIVDVPFSCWRTGSVDLITYYLPRSYLNFFCIVAFVTTFERCRTFLFVNIGAAVIAILSCVTFGRYSIDGRLTVPDSLFLSNSNELGLQLLLGATQLVYLLFLKGVFKKIFAVGMIAVSLMYMLRAGSRACLLGALCYAAFLMVMSKKRVLVAALALVIAVIGFATVPGTAMRRLMLLFDDSLAASEGSAVASQMTRKELFRRSLVATIQHPLFGVGPGQFPVYIAAESTKQGRWAEWLGTHNSYTQVSAECGILAFVSYMAVMWFCFRLNYRVLRITKRDPRFQEVAGLSFVLLSMIVTYAFCANFFHMAYTSNLPNIAGMTLALYLTKRDAIRTAIDPNFA